MYWIKRRGHITRRYCQGVIYIIIIDYKVGRDGWWTFGRSSHESNKMCTSYAHNFLISRSLLTPTNTGSGRKSPSITTFNNIFKQSSTNQEGVEIVEQPQPSSPSKGSQCQSNDANNSNSTNPTNKTEPLTTSTTNKDTQLEHSRKTGMLMKDGCFIHEPTTTSSSAVVGTAATPLTPGGQSSQILQQNHSSIVGASTPNTTTTALGVSGSMAVGESGRTTAGMTNFWNNHAQPHATLSPSNGGDGSQQSNATSSYIKPSTKKPPSSLSMAAADAVLGLITKAEAFLVSTTGVSPSNGSGLCGSSPTTTTMERPSSNSNQRSSSAPANLNNSNDLAGIPEGEDEHTTNSDKLGFCGNLNTGVGGCFEFEDFGFNAFQDNSDRYYDTKVNNKNTAQQDQGGIKEDKRPSDGPPQPSLTTSPSELNQPKGYEIRLKSSFSQLKAKEDKDKSNNPPSAFGRTHPNKNNTNYKKSKSQPNITTKESSHEDYGSSRALPDGLPFRELSVPSEIEHSVSELTMRSHGAFERHKYTSDSRRMAYYAVGRTTSMNDESGSRKSSSGGNRRCYFTGHSILFGMPFYAGSVQQGPRTLVVFCLPSALGLGTKENKNGTTSSSTRPIAKFSSKAERDRYLESLPDPDQKLLQEMSKRYPEPFDTLPVQVRSPHCWRLFVKFCFFSGLPIAEGEMHYRVKSRIRVMASSQQQQQQQEEIALSHEVMEGELFFLLLFVLVYIICGYKNTPVLCMCRLTPSSIFSVNLTTTPNTNHYTAVNGEVSAELLRLPNQKVFDYLKRQYSQQSSKLNSEVFGRNSWEVVMAEV